MLRRAELDVNEKRHLSGAASILDTRLSCHRRSFYVSGMSEPVGTCEWMGNLGGQITITHDSNQIAQIQNSLRVFVDFVIEFRQNVCGEAGF
jgi:hypothetical protein